MSRAGLEVDIWMDGIWFIQIRLPSMRCICISIFIYVHNISVYIYMYICVCIVICICIYTWTTHILNSQTPQTSKTLKERETEKHHYTITIIKDFPPVACHFILNVPEQVLKMHPPPKTSSFQHHLSVSNTKMTELIFLQLWGGVEHIFKVESVNFSKHWDEGANTGNVPSLSLTLCEWLSRFPSVLWETHSQQIPIKTWML